MNEQLLRDRLRMGEALLTRRAERSLYEYAQQAWVILEPHTPFLPNWHLELICEYLEAVTAGEIRRLVINIPPRYMKSLLVSVLWPTWEWIHHPHMRWLCASYSEALAIKHSLDRRTLLQSDWYRAQWGTRVRLRAAPNDKTEYQNDHRGSMTAISVGGSATGKGGNRLIVDDPHNPVQAESDRQREHALSFFSQTLSTRLDDKQHGAIVVVMQRLHHRDLSALCVEVGYTQLCLPAEAETPTVVTFPRSGRTIARAVGEPLWPAREGPAELAVQKQILGSYAYAGQYQQRPSPRGGGLFKREWFRYYDDVPVLDRMAQSWDLAFKDGETNDFVVGLIAGQRGADIYLIDRYKAHVSFQQTCRAIQTYVTRYPRATAVYIEDAANGPAVIDALRHQVPGLIAVKPEGGKFSRAAACEPRVEAGNIYLPRPTTPHGSRMPEREWVDDFVEQLAAFPRGEHDDDVDAFAQLLVQWSKASIVPIGFPISVGTGRSYWAMGDEPDR